MKKINELLSKVGKNTMWGYAIHSHINHGGKVSELIVSLRSQSIDNPKMMKEILGFELYNLIVKTKDIDLWESHLKTINHDNRARKNYKYSRSS
jgi:hypothetical protein